MTIDKSTDWTFKNKEVADEFETHVREQLPWYEQVKSVVSYIVRSYANKGGLIYDIGCSTGNIARALEPIAIKRNIKIIGLDESKEMLDLYPKSGEAVLTNALDYDYGEYDVAILLLVAMFFDSHKRKDFLDKLYQRKKRNGVMIIVDKFAGKGGYFSTVMSRFNILLKLENKVDPDSIINKELSLTGVQIPLSHNELPGNPTMFFKMGDFEGWVVE